MRSGTDSIYEFRFFSVGPVLFKIFLVHPVCTTRFSAGARCSARNGSVAAPFSRAHLLFGAARSEKFEMRVQHCSR